MTKKLASLALAAFCACSAPAAAINATTADIGKVIGANGNVYATVADATPWEAYAGEDTPVVLNAPNTPTAPTTLPTTVLGQNVVSLFPDGALTDANPTQAIDLITATAAMDLTYRLDPTLAFNSLRGA